MIVKVGTVIKHRGFDAVVVARYWSDGLYCIRWVNDGTINYAHGIEIVDEA